MSFREAATGCLRSKAAHLQQLLESRELDLSEEVGLAAHIFAFATQLLLHEGSARLKAPRHLMAGTTMQELLESFRELPPDIDAATLYWRLIAALRACESLICTPPEGPPTRPGALPRWTQLEDLGLGDFRGVAGRVHHWIRPLSAMTALRESRFEEADAVPPDPEPHPGTYLRRLAMYWDSDPQLPGVRRARASVAFQGCLDERVPDSGHCRSFRIALCPLPGPFHPLFEIDSAGRHFRTLSAGSPMHDGAALRQHLEAVLMAAVESGVQLLLLPELTIDLETRDWVASKLAAMIGNGCPLVGLVPGSFHLPGDPAPGGELALPWNGATLLDAVGKPVLHHRKKGRFRILRRQIRAGRALFPNLDPEAPLAREIFEDIRYGRELEVLDTPLGRLVLLICADAIAPDDRGYLPLVRRLRPDLLLVVSMTPETGLFSSFAEEMRSFWIGTAFVNAHCICVPRATGLITRAARGLGRRLRIPHLGHLPPELASCDLALQELPGSPPTRVRWQLGQADPECFYYQPADGKRRKSWRLLSRAPGETGVSALRIGGAMVGLVVDLGAQWQGSPHQRA